MINERYLIWMSKKKMTSCILILPGRDQTGVELAKQWSNTFLDSTAIVLITPINREWYPMPNGVLDQKEAVSGLIPAKKVIDNVVKRINSELKIPNHKIAIAGFSAGGVMANYVCSNSNNEYAACICHSGAILEPEKVPKCKFKKMPFVLTHSYDDDAFDWEERYIPMKNSLIKNEYNLQCLESRFGHHVYDEEIDFSASVICKRLGYNI